MRNVGAAVIGLVVLLVRADGGQDMATVAAEVSRQKIPGLTLYGGCSDEDLAHLKELKGLQWLDLRSCNRVTGAGVRELRKSLPDTTIYHMGVTPSM